MLLRCLLLSVCIAFSVCEILQRQRKGKFFAGVYTSTVKKTYLITSIEPSSCVQVEPTLPFCRNVRQLADFPRVVGRTVADTKEGDSPLFHNGQLHTTAPGWAEYLGIAQKTVTLVEPIVHTVTRQDPNVVVTFSVKGCKPSALPLDMERCQPSPSIYIEQILPTSTAEQLMKTTSPDIPVELQAGENVEPAEEYLANDNIVRETEALQSVQ